MTIYRAGIIGLRGIGASRPKPAHYTCLGSERPHSHAAAYAAVPQIQVVAVCDLVPDLLENFAQTWDGTWPHVERYTDYHEMLERERLDILSVATSDHTHAQIVVDACEAGVKAIYCEKPLATTLADADRMIAAIEHHRVVASVNHWTRWTPETLLARETLRQGTIGQLKRIVQTGCGPRAMLFRNGTYAMDYLSFFAEADPIEVFAELDPEFEHYGPRYAGDGGHDPATDPGTSAYIRFANGVRGFLNFSQGTVDYWETFLMGEQGWIRFGNDVPFEIAVRDSAGSLQRTIALRPPVSQSGMIAAVAELVAVLDRGGETLSPPRDARKCVEMMLAALHSHYLGGVRVRLPLDEEAPRREGRQAAGSDLPTRSPAGAA
jgi:predicted dehydrogenase